MSSMIPTEDILRTIPAAPASKNGRSVGVYGTATSQPPQPSPPPQRNEAAPPSPPTNGGAMGGYRRFEDSTTMASPPNPIPESQIDELRDYYHFPGGRDGRRYARVKELFEFYFRYSFHHHSDVT